MDSEPARLTADTSFHRSGQAIELHHLRCSESASKMALPVTLAGTPEEEIEEERPNFAGRGQLKSQGRLMRWEGSIADTISTVS